MAPTAIKSSALKKPGSSLALGARVRVVKGSLAGLVGRVTDLANHRRMVTIDGFEEGVYVVVDRQMLRSEA